MISPLNGKNLAFFDRRGQMLVVLCKIRYHGGERLGQEALRQELTQQGEYRDGLS
jgi:hypothetical protein